ncbi:DUF2156 domain-containing protein [Microbacterium sp. W1N]|uniref:bifunctional lysylphosphatidylglycerol flippase/synthetase MprF n=1 Tax=Microbacterium festucae TaxID=2977531 RepID=UPI0021BF9DD0|nr:DUF2156 domain-containing protein [Microbacterium festucae]MCT9820849.1 DUF2156 domain-containing protein [Microbacterium festucae]
METDTLPDAAAAPTRPSRVARTLGVLRRTAATWTLIVAILVVGVISGALWSPFADSPALGIWGYGLPALEEGRWWTPVTGTFLVDAPWVYVPMLLGLVGMLVLEYRCGARVALGYFWVGQLFAVLGAALLIWLASFVTDWDWAQDMATILDVGASGGAFACLAALAGRLPSPWRLRAWLVLLGVVIVGFLFIGSLADVEHLLAVLLVLVVDRSFQPRRTTVREQRLIAFVGLLAFGAISIVAAVVPIVGPVGSTVALEDSTPWDNVINTVLVLIVADGIRRARRWAWLVAMVQLGLNVLAALLLYVLYLLADDSVVSETAQQLGVTTEIATGVLALCLLVYLIVIRRAFRWRRKSPLGAAPSPTRDEVADMIRQHGGGTLSWMTTWEGMAYARTTHGIVAYQRRAGVALALADPLGPADTRAQSAREFIEMVEHAGLVPCFFSASEPTRAALPEPWGALIVADDTIVDLPGLAYTGKRWNSVRTSINRAGRDEIDFHLGTLKDEPWGVQAQLDVISGQWVGDKDLPEMRFTLGTLDEAADREARVAIAKTTKGDVEGFLSWLPIYGEGAIRGWTLDLMRRRDGGTFPPVMEYLIGMSAVAFRDEGAEIMSLSGAPLTHEYPPEADLIATLSTRLADMLEPVYGFKSLHRFKQKFNPRHETLFLLYRDAGDLPRIGRALTGAFLPDATLGQFARAGLDIVRKKD